MFRYGALIGIAATALLPGAAKAHAQATTSYTPPLTATGKPDLQGFWTADFITSLERPDDVKGLIVPADKAVEVVKSMTPTPKGAYDPDFEFFFPNTLLVMQGEFRSSWIVEPGDGRLPLTALGKAAQERGNDLAEHSYDNPEERPTAERCVSGLGYAPVMAISAIIPTQIVQTPDALVLWTEDSDGGRIIDLAGLSPPAVIRTRMGDAHGHWEANTLVVETTHIAATDPSGVQHRGAVVLGEGSRVIERFSLLSHDDLLYQFTVIDPSLYAQPWLAEYVMKRQTGPAYEYACHEGNRSMVSILQAARLDRQEKPQPKATPKK